MKTIWLRRKSLLTLAIAVGVPVLLFWTDAFRQLYRRPVPVAVIVVLGSCYGLYEAASLWRRGE